MRPQPVRPQPKDLRRQPNLENAAAAHSKFNVRSRSFVTCRSKDRTDAGAAAAERFEGTTQSTKNAAAAHCKSTVSSRSSVTCRSKDRTSGWVYL